MEDKRNVMDEFRGWSHEDIVQELDKRGVVLEIAIENLDRDFNMGTIVRSANAFGVRIVHIIGRKQWNKRGAMITDKYLHIIYYAAPDEFCEAMKHRGREIIAIENNVVSTSLGETSLPKKCVLVFGSEGNGISDELLSKANRVIHIEQFGSTRSVNVGVASGIAMYIWVQQHALDKRALM